MDRRRIDFLPKKHTHHPSYRPLGTLEKILGRRRRSRAVLRHRDRPSRSFHLECQPECARHVNHGPYHLSKRALPCPLTLRAFDARPFRRLFSEASNTPPATAARTPSVVPSISYHRSLLSRFGNLPFYLAQLG